MSDTVTITLDREAAQRIINVCEKAYVGSLDPAYWLKKQLEAALNAPVAGLGDLPRDLEMWAKWIGDECAKGMEDTNRLLCAGDLRRAAAALDAQEVPHQALEPVGEEPIGCGGSGMLSWEIVDRIVADNDPRNGTIAQRLGTIAQRLIRMLDDDEKTCPGCPDCQEDD